jgi:two-component system, response regulator PdtaR
MLAAEGGTAPRELTVLLVEDEVLTRLMLADELRSQGLQVLEASNADEALTVLQSSLPVHLLFTDIRMPGEMDGMALAKFAHAHFPRIKRIIGSSGRGPNSRSETLPTRFSPSPTTCAHWSSRSDGY